MTNTLEMNMGIIPINDAIKTYFEHFPNDALTKFKLAHKGPFYKYSFIGNDGLNRHSLKLNAKTGDVMKNTVKKLKPKRRDPLMREGKRINLDNLLSFSEINEIALKAAPVSIPLQWKLERKRERTLWEVKITDELGANKYKVKIDAHDGSLMQIKMKA